MYTTAISSLSNVRGCSLRQQAGELCGVFSYKTQRFPTHPLRRTHLEDMSLTTSFTAYLVKKACAGDILESKLHVLLRFVNSGSS